MLGLAYFYSGSENAMCLQVWGTWMLYVVLVDLTDAVAETLQKPFAAISMEMIYRSLYFFGQAVGRGEATALVPHLVANAEWLGLLKRKRRRLSFELLQGLTNAAGP